MKLIGNFNKFCLVVLVSFLVGFIGYFIYNSKTEYKNVNGTAQEFPIELTDDYKITNAYLDEYEISITLVNTKTGEEYESSLPSEDIEDFVCHIKYYDSKGVHDVYDCSTEDYTVKSMIIELGKQTIEVINEGN